MAPNWFIAFPVQVANLRLPPAPARVRVFGGADLHITLGFLGSVQASEALKAWAGVADYDSLRPVTGSFTGVEPLGNPRKPSALCAIVDSGRVEISEMISDARGPALAAAGAPEDCRPPLPHMTLARVQRRATAAERRQALRWARTIDLRGLKFTVSEVALYTWAEDRQERLFKIVERRELGA